MLIAGRRPCPHASLGPATGAAAAVARAAAGAARRCCQAHPRRRACRGELVNGTQAQLSLWIQSMQASDTMPFWRTPEQRLMAAARGCSTAHLAAALAEAPHSGPVLAKALAAACLMGQADIAHALLEAGADPNSEVDPRQNYRCRPIHLAAAGWQQAPERSSGAACVALLLAAGADPAALDSAGGTALHCAADADTARLLMAAAPQAAAMRTARGRTPLQCALSTSHASAAVYLAAEAPLQPADEIAAALFEGLRRMHESRKRRLELLCAVPVLEARLNADLQSWYTYDHAPNPLLPRVLATVLDRSEAAAGRLVRCLPSRDRKRLSTLALCLAHMERRLSAPPQGAGATLPAPIVRRLLVEAAECNVAASARRCLYVCSLEPEIFDGLAAVILILVVIAGMVWHETRSLCMMIAITLRLPAIALYFYLAFSILRALHELLSTKIIAY